MARRGNDPTEKVLGRQQVARAHAEHAKRILADRTMTDLDCWHRFEEERPDAFRAMYQFWVQKRAAGGK
jgi:hypothetical protein